MKSYNLGSLMHHMKKHRLLCLLFTDFGTNTRYDSKNMVIALFLLVLLGFGSIESLGNEMRDPYLKNLCNFNSVPDQSTFNRFLKGIDYQKMREQNKKLVKRIRRNRKTNIYALDSTYLEVFGKFYTFVGKVYNYVTKKNIKGYKLVGIIDVFSGISVGWKFVQCNLHENNFLKELVDYMIKSGHKPDVLLFDKGFYDCKHFKYLTKNKIVYVCPMKEYKTNVKQIECFGLDEDKELKKKIIGDKRVKISGISKKQRAIVIKKGDRKYTLLTNGFSLPKETIVEYYSLRWNVENHFKVLKHDWNIRKFPTTDYKGLRFYAEMVMYAYNVHISYRMHTGKNMGIKQMRKKEFEVVAPTIIPEPESFQELLKVVKNFFSKKITNSFGS